MYSFPIGKKSPSGFRGYTGCRRRASFVRPIAILLLLCILLQIPCKATFAAGIHSSKIAFTQAAATSSPDNISQADATPPTDNVSQTGATPSPDNVSQAPTAEPKNISETFNEADDTMGITAKAAVLIENHSGRILYEKSKDTELIPASITKIMTLLLIFDAIKAGKIGLEDEVSVSEFAAKMGGSQVYLEPGETQTVNDMIKCICIASANDAAVAMAEYIGGSEPSFVNMMNEKAKELGMEHTHFMNCNGLDDTIQSGHYSSAYDVALMSRELVTKHPEISNYSTVWMDEITHKTKKGESQFGLTNTNKLVRTYNGITGLKTGSTSKAKYCLSATAERNGISLTAVIMASPDPRIRFSQAASLLDYGFANCTNFTDKKDSITLEARPLSHGSKSTVIPRIEKDFSYTLTNKDDVEQIQRKITWEKNLTAPVKEGQQIGAVVYSIGGNPIGELPIYAAETVEKATFLNYIQKVLNRYLLTEKL